MGKPRYGVIYGVRLRTEFDYRYIGLTTKSENVRLREHFRVARAGRKTPFYDWLRKQNRDDVIADVLDWVYGLDRLGRAEIEWIAYLRREGQPLLNLAAGGLGPTGVIWTTEMREAARIRATGRPGLRRFGEAAPFFGHTHSAAQRAKWSAERKGMNSGEANPNYGKFGPEHPGFGRVMSEESRRRLSEMRTGAGNPNFGRKASAETRAKMSAVRKGRPMPSSKRNAHTRHHTNKGVFKPSCTYCVEDLAKPNDPKPGAES
ncbi:MULTISPECIES: NUMOD3 domain-containing DNA-binding protein [unclassified Nocardia]|uniref:NUMOD3 domain-containing DNA-binding protein n=1 Tax=unclassified Nocardia TaxID=2637762 RepID=UPI0033B6DB68